LLFLSDRFTIEDVSEHEVSGRRPQRSPRLGDLCVIASCALVILLSPFVAAYAQQSETIVLAPARAGLDPISFPQLDALEAAVAGHLRDARLTFEKTPSNGSARDLADAYGALGRVFHAYEFFEAADACYRNATTLRPGDGRWLHLRAYLLQQTGRFDDAVPLYLAARRASAEDYAAAVHLGDTYLGLGRLADAREQFESTLQRYPAASNAGLGEIALRERKYQDAIQHFEAALERIPDATSLEYSLGMAYRGLGRIDEARAHLQRRGSGGVRVADPLVDELQTLVRGERAFVMQGRRAYEAGQFQAAADAFRKAAAVAPADATPHVNLAAALAQLGDANGTAEQLAIAVRLEPDNEATLLNLAIVLSDRERYREAVQHLEDSHRRFPDRAPTATTLARLLASSPDRSLRDGSRAFEIATAINQREPSPTHGETVAMALAELGRCDEAAEWMRRAIDDADRTKETAEAARLRGEAGKYAMRPCRP
jgi:tetratricopeptide (TPR) repeat protein